MCDGILIAHWSVECARCDFAGSDSAAAAAADYDYVPDFLLLAVMVRFTPAVAVTVRQTLAKSERCTKEKYLFTN